MANLKQAYNIEQDKAVMVKEQKGTFYQWEDRPIEERTVASPDPGQWIAVGIDVLLLAEQIWPLLKALWAIIRATFTNNKELKAEAKLHLRARKALKG